MFLNPIEAIYLFLAMYRNLKKEIKSYGLQYRRKRNYTTKYIY